MVTNNKSKPITFKTKTNLNIKNKQLSITLPKKQIKKYWKVLPGNLKVTIEVLE